MNACATNHPIIYYNEIECPCCALIKEICDLEKKVGTLENTVEELRETVEMYQDNQRNRKASY